MYTKGFNKKYLLVDRVSHCSPGWFQIHCNLTAFDFRKLCRHVIFIIPKLTIKIHVGRE